MLSDKNIRGIDSALRLFHPLVARQQTVVAKRSATMLSGVGPAVGS